ncbi:hypothetical protein Vretimale_17891, partial [Volvox reticuliferus]
WRYNKNCDQLHYLRACPGSKVLPAEEGDTELKDSILARFMGKPSKSHMGLALGILRYLAGTRELGLCFGSAGEFTLEGYSDYAWAGNPATRRSTTGYVFTLGGAAISWNSQL